MATSRDCAFHGKDSAKRKAKIRANLENTDFLHYPRAEVEQVLKFWNVDLS